MMQRAPNGNTLIKTKCLCVLLFSHAEDLAIHGVSVDIAEAPHFSLLFELNLEACWATIQKTAHEHSLKIYSGTVTCKHICPADSVAQQS